MAAKIMTYPEYVTIQKKKAENRKIRKKIADYLFSFFVRFVVVLLGLGILFGLYILLATIISPLVGFNLLESESAAEQRYREQVEYTIEEVAK